MISRRGVITGLISLAAALAIVRVESLMPVRVMEPVSNLELWLQDWHFRTMMALQKQVEIEIMYGQVFTQYQTIDGDMKIKVISPEEYYKGI